MLSKSFAVIAIAIVVASGPVQAETAPKSPGTASLLLAQQPASRSVLGELFNTAAHVAHVVHIFSPKAADRESHSFNSLDDWRNNQHCRDEFSLMFENKPWPWSRSECSLRK
jgi:hypothetical protein